MTDHDGLIIKNILKWVSEFVSRPNNKLNGFSPCPFAVDAIEANKVLFLTNCSDDIALTQEKIEAAAKEIIENKFEVAVIVHEKYKSWSVSEVKAYVLDWREKFRDKDLYLLKDHPEDEEIVSGVKMNQGQFLVFFVQRSSILIRARKKLWEQGYYESWSDEEKARVFGSLNIKDEN